MNLIKSSTDEDHLRRFFAEQLIPIALKLRKDDTHFFSLEPDSKTEGADDDSWYVTCPEDTPELVEFDASNLEAELHKLWASQGLSQLGELAEPIAELARRMKMPTPCEDTNISPFIYVMF